MWDRESGLPLGKSSIPDIETQQQFVSESEKAWKLLKTSESTFGDLDPPFLELSPQITPMSAKAIVTKSAEVSKLQIEDYSEFFQCSVGDFVKARYKDRSKFHRCIVLRRQHNKAILKYLELGKIETVNLSSIKSTLYVKKSVNTEPINKIMPETRNERISEDFESFLGKNHRQSYSAAETSALKMFNNFVGGKVKDEEAIDGMQNEAVAIRRKGKKTESLESGKHIPNHVTMYGACTGNRKHSQSNGCFVS